MLQALLKNKLKESFSLAEDRQTSSVFGLLQYLPVQTMWNLLRQSCGDKSLLVEESGKLLHIHFWPRWSAEGDDISNSNYVEPDVFCEFERFDLIIEAKKDDQSGQYDKQWKNEINAYLNEYQDSKKELYFIAIGGNKTLRTERIRARNGEYIIFLASWQNLLNEIEKSKKKFSDSEPIKRILSDIILAFEKHNFFCLEWLESLSEKSITQENSTLIASWKFHAVNIFDNFHESSYHNVNNNSKNNIELWNPN